MPTDHSFYDWAFNFYVVFFAFLSWSQKLISLSEIIKKKKQIHHSQVFAGCVWTKPAICHEMNAL